MRSDSVPGGLSPLRGRPARHAGSPRSPLQLSGRLVRWGDDERTVSRRAFVPTGSLISARFDIVKLNWPAEGPYLRYNRRTRPFVGAAT